MHPAVAHVLTDLEEKLHALRRENDQLRKALRQQAIVVSPGATLHLRDVTQIGWLEMRAGSTMFVEQPMAPGSGRDADAPVVMEPAEPSASYNCQ